MSTNIKLIYAIYRLSSSCNRRRNTNTPLFHGIKLSINMPVASLLISSFIYFVQFTADVAQTPLDVDLMLEIVVGTIPLEGHYSLPDYPAATAGLGRYNKTKSHDPSICDTIWSNEAKVGIFQN